jgi:hypothetical protein
MKMWKVYDNDDRQLKDKFWSEKLTWAFDSGELKIQNKFCLKVAIKKIWVTVIWMGKSHYNKHIIFKGMA